MRKEDIRMLLRYFYRIAKNPFSRQSRSALARYLGEGVMYLTEKMRGLDFTMVYSSSGDNPHNSSYSKAPERVLRRMFNDIDSREKHKFMDIGCGKGYVLSKAFVSGFGEVGGVEYSEGLVQICRKNLGKLGFDSKNVYWGDARQFDRYGDYDIFFMNNPFDETVLSEVAKKIIEEHDNKTCFIYYLNPAKEERQKAIIDSGFRLVKVIKDKKEKYFDINVYCH